MKDILLLGKKIISEKCLLFFIKDRCEDKGLLRLKNKQTLCLLVFCMIGNCAFPII